jgi:hypothetical protein
MLSCVMFSEIVMSVGMLSVISSEFSIFISVAFFSYAHCHTCIVLLSVAIHIVMLCRIFIVMLSGAFIIVMFINVI